MLYLYVLLAGITIYLSIFVNCLNVGMSQNISKDQTICPLKRLKWCEIETHRFHVNIYIYIPLYTSCWESPMYLLSLILWVQTRPDWSTDCSTDYGFLAIPGRWELHRYNMIHTCLEVHLEEKSRTKSRFILVWTHHVHMFSYNEFFTNVGLEFVLTYLSNVFGMVRSMFDLNCLNKKGWLQPLAASVASSPLHIVFVQESTAFPSRWDQTWQQLGLYRMHFRFLNIPHKVNESTHIIYLTYCIFYSIHYILHIIYYTLYILYYILLMIYDIIYYIYNYIIISLSYILCTCLYLALHIVTILRCSE